MKMHRDRIVGQNVVTAFGEGYVDVNGMRHTSSLLLTPDDIEADWAAGGFDTLSEADFGQLAELGCEVLLFGTGRHQRFPDPALLGPLMAVGIGVEVMDSGAAARTFNILVAEGRKVVAAILIDR